MHYWDDELPVGCSAGVLACEFSGRPARCWCWRREAAATRRRDACATGRFVESLLSLRAFIGIMNWFVLVLVLVLVLDRMASRTRRTTSTRTRTKGRFMERRLWICRWWSLIAFGFALSSPAQEALRD